MQGGRNASEIVQVFFLLVITYVVAEYAIRGIDKHLLGNAGGCTGCEDEKDTKDEEPKTS